MKAAGGAEHSAITADGGTMYTFGWGRYGNLGHGHTRDLHVPTRVEGLEGQMVTDPICGWRHSAALTDQGRLWTFGWSKYGQLGHGDNIDHWSPKILPEFAGGPITAAAGGWRHMCALAGSSGTLYSWGWNQFGQLGIGSTEDSNAPRKVVVGTDCVPVSAVACGHTHHSRRRRGRGCLRLGSMHKRSTWSRRHHTTGYPYQDRSVGPFETRVERQN